MTKTFVFDADGVLCTGANFTVALEREHGIPRERLVDFFRDVFPACLIGQRDLQEALQPYLTGWGWRQSTRDFLEFWFRSENQVCPQVLECVRILRGKGCPCLLGTNQEKYRLAYFREVMGLDRHFDRIFSSCDVGAAKPSSSFFQAIVEERRLRPQGFWLVDDAGKNVAAAQSAGWNAIHYLGTSDLPDILRLAGES